MPLLGQASGGFTESSSALRLLHVGIRNTVGVLTADSFTQTNPPAVVTDISTQVDQTRIGVLSGSVAFARPDAGSNFIGGPGLAATQVAIQANPSQAIGYRALGVFINGGQGNAFENAPAAASGKNPYVSSQGTYGNQLFETSLIANSQDVGNTPAGTAIVYVVGQRLIASRNGYLMPSTMVSPGDGAIDLLDSATMSAESFVGDGVAAGVADRATIMGVLKMPADAVQNEIVYDQRV